MAFLAQAIRRSHEARGREGNKGRRTSLALVPGVVARLLKAGLDVWVEAGAGEGAFFPDTAYEAAGARVTRDVPLLLEDADIALNVVGGFLLTDRMLRMFKRTRGDP